LLKGENLQTGQKFEKKFDYVIVCTGVYHDPNLPQIEDLDKFKGEILHPFQVQNNKEQFSGKKVVVLGYGKSGLDIAKNSSDYAESTTHVFRTAHWLLPRFVNLQSLTEVIDLYWV